MIVPSHISWIRATYSKFPRRWISPNMIESDAPQLCVLHELISSMYLSSINASCKKNKQKNGLVRCISHKHPFYPPATWSHSFTWAFSTPVTERGRKWRRVFRGSTHSTRTVLKFGTPSWMSSTKMAPKMMVATESRPESWKVWKACHGADGDVEF